jgi:hypothetical protein
LCTGNQQRVQQSKDKLLKKVKEELPHHADLVEANCVVECKGNGYKYCLDYCEFTKKSDVLTYLRNKDLARSPVLRTSLIAPLSSVFQVLLRPCVLLIGGPAVLVFVVVFTITIMLQ